MLFHRVPLPNQGRRDDFVRRARVLGATDKIVARRRQNARQNNLATGFDYSADHDFARKLGIVFEERLLSLQFL
jgi:hypothetical protein